MASKTKNPERTRAITRFKKAQKMHDKANLAQFLAANAGKKIKHKDRVYQIAPDGSYRRLTKKEDVVRNSKDY